MQILLAEQLMPCNNVARDNTKAYLVPSLMARDNTKAYLVPSRMARLAVVDQSPPIAPLDASRLKIILYCANDEAIKTRSLAQHGHCCELVHYCCELVNPMCTPNSAELGVHVGLIVHPSRGLE